MLLQNSNLFAANLNGCTLANAALTGLRLSETCLRGADLRGSDLGPVDLDRLGALSGAIISRAQAGRILVELANVVVTH